MRYYAPLTQLGPNRWADRAATLLWNHGGWVRRSSWAQRSVAARRLLRRRRVVDGAARPESGELFTSAMEDEHLERTHRGQGALARLLRQQVATLEHGLAWTEPVGECVRDGRLRADRCTQPSRGASDAAVPGGCSLAGPEQPAMQPSAGDECSDQPPAALGWGVLLGLPESAPRCSLVGWSTGALGRWGAGALGRWQAG